MNGELLQAKIYGGYASAAIRLGLPCNQYRPTIATSAAIAAGNLVQSLNASFNAQDFQYKRPQLYGKAAWFALVDGTQVKPGDYLQRPDGVIFFIAVMQPLLPIVAVECNRVISIAHPQQQVGIGATGYSGETALNNTPLVTEFPASLLQGTKGEKSEANLPGDVRSPWWTILLPNLPQGVYLRTDDIVTDDETRQYKISSAEQTELGWRITAAQEQT